MSSWVNRTELTGSSVAANGTTSHTCTFTPATSGNMLVAVVAGAVTFTTPTGWTLVISAVNKGGLYVFRKTAAAAEASFTTTHNGSNRPILGVVYEFATGSTIAGTAGTATGQAKAATGPAATSLTGSYTRFAARGWVMASATTATGSCVWTLPTVEDYDASVSNTGSVGGEELTIAYDDSSTGTSFTPSSTITTTSDTSSGEGVSWAVTVAAGGDVTETLKPAATSWAGVTVTATGTASPVAESMGPAALAWAGTSPTLDIVTEIEGDGPPALAWAGTTAHTVAQVVEVASAGGIAWAATVVTGEANHLAPSSAAGCAWAGTSVTTSSITPTVVTAGVAATAWAGTPATVITDERQQAIPAGLAWTGTTLTLNAPTDSGHSSGAIAWAACTVRAVANTNSRDIQFVGSLEPARLTGTIEPNRPHRILGAAMRTLYTKLITVSAEYVWLDATDRLSGDLSADTVKVGLAPYGPPPTTWIDLTGSDVIQFPAVGKMRIGMLIGAGGHDIAAGVYYAWLLITDHPEVPPVLCGVFQIV